MPKPQLAGEGMAVNKQREEEGKTYQFQGSSAGLYPAFLQFINYRKHFSVSAAKLCGLRTKISYPLRDQTAQRSHEHWETCETSELNQEGLHGKLGSSEDGTVIKQTFGCDYRSGSTSNNPWSTNSGKFKPSGSS